MPVPSAALTVIVAVPIPTACTVPLLTVATFTSDDDHTIFFLPPLLTFTVAVSLTLSPILSVSEVLFNLILVIFPFTTLTVIVAFFLGFFLEITVIFAVPTFFPVITPLLVTVATFLLELLYVTFLFADLFGVTVTVVFKVAFFPFAR